MHRFFHSIGPSLGVATAILFSSLSLEAGDSGDMRSADSLRHVKRIVFLGDSITQKGDYIADVECWLLSQGMTPEVLNLGLGSETATDLSAQENEGHIKKFGFGRPAVSERIDRVLEQTKPDLLFICYGMNDGVELDRYAEAINALRKKALASGVKTHVFCTPPVRDNKKDLASNPEDQKLASYSEWFLQKKEEGWLVVDIHGPMRKALDQGRAENPNFAFAPDGVHPSREGHWVMAKQILEQIFGADTSAFLSAEQILPANGDKVRPLVLERLNLLSNAWMTQIGHTRPFLAGGPNSQPGLPVPEAEEKAKSLSNQIQQLLHSPNPQTKS